MYELIIKTGFSAAHNLRGYEGECERLHGHNWKVEVVVQAERLNDIDIALDFKVLKRETNAIMDRLDHRYLNEVPPFDRLNTTAENIARYIYQELSQRLHVQGVRVKEVRVWESETACAVYYE